MEAVQYAHAVACLWILCERVSVVMGHGRNLGLETFL